ncbi:four and a half LIM domains protein 1-like [Convolutriloba macropyga]|uniref:four and a half LIM domains protein 1-like n=1 Tax=Convolutriloba macropyga TaxID=536237 RepID=UPI003F528732
MSLEDLFISVCDKCKKDIYGVAVHEDTLSFHEDCFLCEYRSHAANKGGTGRRHRVTERICGAKLGGQPYYFVNKGGGGGGPVGVGGVRCCQECYKREIAATCQKCAKKIIGCKRVEIPTPSSSTIGSKMTSRVFFHEECFTCVDCSVQMGSSGSEFTQIPSVNSSFGDYNQSEQQTYERDYICKGCFFTRYPHRLCYQCDQLIEGGNTVEDADGNFYHSLCFACCRCERPLDPTQSISGTLAREYIYQLDGEERVDCSYVEYEGNTYCPDCYNNNLVPKCAICDKAIPADNAQVMYKEEIYCERCFECSKCGRDLTHMEFLDSTPRPSSDNPLPMLQIECAEKDQLGKCL